MAIALLALYLVNDLPASGRVGFASGTAPRLFAYGLLALGGALFVSSWVTSGPGLQRLEWRGLLTILGAIVLFALVIRDLGLIATGIPMVMLASFAAKDARWMEAGIFAVVITIFCAILFPVVLGQPIPLWPRF